MSVQQRYDVTFASLTTEFGGKAYSHETVSVTKTDTMTHGSMLIAANTEAAISAVADVTKVIDDPSIDLVATGDTALVSVAVRGNVFNTASLTFSDAGAAVPAALTGMADSNIYK